MAKQRSKRGRPSEKERLERERERERERGRGRERERDRRQEVTQQGTVTRRTMKHRPCPDVSSNVRKSA